MNGSLKKTAIAAVAALALGAGVAVSTTAPAEAYCGGHGCYGGGWGHGGGGWGWGVGAGILGGAVLGAAIANSNNYGPGPYYGGPGPYYGGSCMQPRPTYDAYGRYLGRRMVNLCE